MSVFETLSSAFFVQQVTDIDAENTCSNSFTTWNCAVSVVGIWFSRSSLQVVSTISLFEPGCTESTSKCKRSGQFS